MLGLETNEDIFFIVRKTRRQVMKMKKELHAYQKEHREAKETLKSILKKRTWFVSLDNDHPGGKEGMFSLAFLLQMKSLYHLVLEIKTTLHQIRMKE